MIIAPCITKPLALALNQAIAAMTTGGASVWSPTQWFAANEQGIWLDPSDFTRYMADKGPELILDSEFNNAGNWTTTPSWTVSGGVATHNGSVADYIYTATEAPVVGKWYELTVTATAVIGVISVYCGQTPAALNITSPGTHKIAVQCPGTGLKFSLRCSNASGGNTVVTAFSAKELTAINTATMFQDSAGTTPVTAVEQPVGLVLDKRLGLVRGAEVVSNGTFATNVAGWEAVNGATVVHSAGAMRITSPGATAIAGARQITSLVLVPGQQFEMSFRLVAIASGAQLYQETLNGNSTSAGGVGYQTTPGTYKFFGTMGTGGDGLLHLRFLVRRAFGNANAGDWVEIDDVSVKVLPGNHASQATTAQKPVLSARKNKLLATTTMATQSVTLTASPHTLSFKGTGTVTLTGASTAGPLVGTGAGNRVSLTFTPAAGSVTFTVSGSVTEAQLENGSAVTAYQRVNTATDYDTAGFPLYLKFDGVDDNLVTTSIDFTATDKMTVIAGVRKLSDAARGMLCELSADINTNNGTFALEAPDAAAAATYRPRSKGTMLATTSVAGYASPVSSVLTQTNDIAADAVALRVNGGAATSSATDQGAGNFGNYPLYIGRRGGTSLPFNGHLYQLIVRGAATPLADIQRTETFAAGKAGVTL